MKLSRPDVLDEDGVPLPWNPPEPVHEALVEGTDDEDAFEAAPSDELGGEAPLWVREEANRLGDLAGLPPCPIAWRPSSNSRRGLCTGRVWMRNGVPLRILLSSCPNSDEAEVLATLAHEFAHPLAGTGHGRGFRAELLALAEDAWPGAFPSADVGQPFRDLDRWLASGIRAARRDREAPIAKTSNDGNTARLVTRIRKLHRLSDAQLGEPEGIAAAARANDLITVYGLGGYRVEIAAGLDDQMVDRWVLVKPRQRWQRFLSHAIARFFGVFSLEMARLGRIHFFGRHADVVATAYLVEVTMEAILRQSDDHIAAWKKVRRRTAGQVRSERTAFCGSATVVFGDRLRELRDPVASTARADAEEFAAVEHDKRGIRWGRARRATVTHNAAGVAAGERLPIVRGMEGRRAPKQLT
ncbi:MAG: DUF2786 domain-containing protein [Proteobacteria bacterium]|nr:DUF2786 domain-containing protein [Pseudomonadota bacterium]MCP4916653.1 DUF2786 domain-containing protein [Pseudomonadota bacterium]